MIEVALIDYRPEGGLKLLGKSNDPELVELVRQALMEELGAVGKPKLKLVEPE